MSILEVSDKEIITSQRFIMSEYTQPPNQNWVEQNVGKRLLLEFPQESYVVEIQRAESQEIEQ